MFDQVRSCGSRLFVTGLIWLAMGGLVAAQENKTAQDKQFRGGLNPVKEQEAPRPVRNDVAQPGEEIVTLRYFKIKKGTFDRFLKASVEGVWPYFEKLGSRVIGMWQVITPEGVDGAPAASPANKDYDEVYLSRATPASSTGKLRATQHSTAATAPIGRNAKPRSICAKA
ncbi:MAG: hypothetical protein AAB401_14270 [Acidobacteriota bacterium]